MKFETDSRFCEIGMFRLSVFVCLFGIALCPICNGQSKSIEPEFQSVELEGGQVIEYGFVVPTDFDSTKEYPILLALPPGAQNKQMVKAGFNLYWTVGSEKGWIVVSPAAPKGKAFNQGSEKLIPKFLDKIKEAYKPVGGKFHLAGISNGGTSAFRIAGLFPEQFHSLMVLPGMPSSAKDKQRLKKLKDLPIAMFVGGEDSNWLEPMKATVAALEKMDTDVIFEIVPDQGHVIQNWQDGEKLFGLLDKWDAEAQK